MTFHMTHAFAVAGVMIASLLAMAISNRKSGWHRERRDPILENLHLWARATAVREALDTTDSDAVSAPAATAGLAALHAALHEESRPLLPVGNAATNDKENPGERPRNTLATAGKK
jgi:hypothetical protein